MPAQCASRVEEVIARSTHLVSSRLLGRRRLDESSEPEDRSTRSLIDVDVSQSAAILGVGKDARELEFGERADELRCSIGRARQGDWIEAEQTSTACVSRMNRQAAHRT